MKFVKGQSGNLKGRPIGIVKNVSKKSISNREYNTALTKLFEALKKGETWACEIFFKNLAPKLEQETLPFEVDQDNPDRMEAITLGVLKVLSQFKAISFNEACNLLTTINHLKFVDGIFKQQDYLQRLLTEEQYKTLRLWLAEAEVRKLN